MFNETLVAALNHLLTLNLWELLTLIALVLVFASLTVKLTKTQREGLVFTLWGIVALFGLLTLRWLSEEPDFMTLLQASGLLPMLFIFATAGLILGAMAFGLYRMFFSAAGGPGGRRSVYYIFKSSLYSPWRTKRNGRKDGAVGASPQHYEEAIAHFAEQIANSIAQQWGENDKTLKPRYCGAVAAREVSQSALTKAKEILSKARAEREQEEKNYKSTYATHHLGTGAYWFLIGLIGVAEAPFNLAAFRSILGEVDAVNIFFSLVVSGIFAFSVHSLGHFFAENPFEKSFKRAIAKNPTSVGAGLFLAFVIIGLARFRESYISSFQKQLGSYGITVDISPGTASLILGLIVAFFALLAIDVSRRRYRPKVAERIMALSQARKYFRRARSEAARAERNHRRALKKFYKAEARRKNEFSFARGAVETMNKRMQELIKLYRMYYERSAKGKRPGEAVGFGALPSLETPEAVRSLDERCTT